MSLLCGLPFAAYLWGACAAPAPLAVGYVEGDYVMLAPIEVAQVTQVAVHRGQTVEAGAQVVRLEDTDARIAVSQAERQWGRDPRRNIRKHLDEAGEQSVIAQFLNGAFAQWVERYTGCRWLPVRPEELDSVHSNSDYAQLLYSHLQGRTAEAAS